MSKRTAWAGLIFISLLFLVFLVGLAHGEERCLYNFEYHDGHTECTDKQGHILKKTPPHKMLEVLPEDTPSLFSLTPAEKDKMQDEVELYLMSIDKLTWDREYKWRSGVDHSCLRESLFEVSDDETVDSCEQRFLTFI